MPESTAVRQSMADSSTRSGQITILFCQLMVLVAGSLAFILNFAGLFAYHAHLQTSVDCSVFSGAVLQARGLNEIARINNDIIRALRNAQSSLSSRIYSSQGAGASAAASAQSNFRNANNQFIARQRNINRSHATDARKKASIIASKNQAGVGGVEFAAFPNSGGQLVDLRQTEGETRSFSYRYYYWVSIWVGSGEDRRRISVRRVGHDSGPSVTAMVVEKGNEDHTYFCARLLRPFREFMFNWGQAWAEGYDDLRTYATAMPHGGRLWDGRRGNAKYDVKLVRTGDVRPQPVIPDVWGYDW